MKINQCPLLVQDGAYDYDQSKACTVKQKRKLIGRETIVTPNLTDLIIGCACLSIDLYFFIEI